MAEREISGYIVRATTEPEHAGAPFYEPAFRIRKVGESYEHPHISYATSQDVESRTQAQALALADYELAGFTEVVWHGDQWDLQPWR